MTDRTPQSRFDEGGDLPEACADRYAAHTPGGLTSHPTGNPASQLLPPLVEDTTEDPCDAARMVVRTGVPRTFYDRIKARLTRGTPRTQPTDIAERTLDHMAAAYPRVVFMLVERSPQHFEIEADGPADEAYRALSAGLDFALAYLKSPRH